MKEKRFNADKYKKKTISHYINYDDIRCYSMYLLNVLALCHLCDGKTEKELKEELGLEITEFIRDCME
jgi:hypothetical protein